jgi:hypothetical protein
MSDKRNEASLGTLAVLALFAVGAVGGILWARSSSEKARAAKQREAIREALDAPRITTTADILGKTYNENPVDFEVLSRGKYGVAVSGTVNQIGMEFGGSNPYITLGAGLVGAVRCEFDAARISDVSGLRKGQKVTVTGIVKGGAMGTVNLDHCEIKP